ncbi:hypothetical protein BD410DRAFT_805378 [Rickenella mellea]|uniref:Uncharacterized protein n=1 Tax=Rickenella mellea TaxID=50990 RepID=A0A4Y7PXZ9_9AGAM|nr:hypothetical protein BD410DRAFT_805378 [Rickenella mellea]
MDSTHIDLQRRLLTLVVAFPPAVGQYVMNVLTLYCRKCANKTVTRLGLRTVTVYGYGRITYGEVTVESVPSTVPSAEITERLLDLASDDHIPGNLRSVTLPEWRKLARSYGTQLPVSNSPARRTTGKKLYLPDRENTSANIGYRVLHKQTRMVVCTAVNGSTVYGFDG